MYVLIVVSLMLVLPALSIYLERAFLGIALSTAQIGRWFVFWGVGVRLFLAGIRQIVQPAYTAEVILGLEGAEAQILVRELGFANVAIGFGGMLSIVARPWTTPSASVGAVFYGLAGINHCLHGERNQLQDVAMVSDLSIAVLLVSYVVVELLQRR